MNRQIRQTNLANNFAVTATSAPTLEIEFIPSDSKPAKKDPCQIRVVNKSSTKNADDLKVEILSFGGSGSV
jgi:hypothetical protein